LPCSAANVKNKSDVSIKESVSSPEQRWGILPLSIQLTAAGQLVDCRFLVVDPNKAAALMKQGNKTYLVGQASGIKIPASRTKASPLNQTGTKPIAGKVYPILFVNTGGVIKAGSKITLVIGEFRLENIVVEAEISQHERLRQAKQAKWDTIRKVLRKERKTCIEQCSQDQNCIAKCEKAINSRLDIEYQKLFNKK
jgi:hypothetical protein